MSPKKRIREKQFNVISEVQVATPCAARWEEMVGDEKVRFCQGRQLPVYNLSAMDVEEAAERIAQDDDRLCVRFYRRADGTILTRDCPLGIQKAYQRRAFINGMAGALISLGVLGTVLMPTQGAVARPAAHRAALFSSALGGDSGRLQVLLHAGISPNIASPSGVTPLMLAAREGQLEAVQLLLKRGAEVNRRDEEGNTAFDLAKAGQHQKVVAALVKAGAKRTESALGTLHPATP